jgi:hypothetical protein
MSADDPVPDALTRHVMRRLHVDNPRRRPAGGGAIRPRSPPMTMWLVDRLAQEPSS